MSAVSHRAGELNGRPDTWSPCYFCQRPVRDSADTEISLLGQWGDDVVRACWSCYWQVTHRIVNIMDALDEIGADE